MKFPYTAFWIASAICLPFSHRPVRADLVFVSGQLDYGWSDQSSSFGGNGLPYDLVGNAVQVSPTLLLTPPGQSYSDSTSSAFSILSATSSVSPASSFNPDYSSFTSLQIQLDAGTTATYAGITGFSAPAASVTYVGEFVVTTPETVAINASVDGQVFNTQGYVSYDPYGLFTLGIAPNSRGVIYEASEITLDNTSNAGLQALSEQMTLGVGEYAFQLTARAAGYADASPLNGPPSAISSSAFADLIISTVPEPSSWMLMACGVLVGLVNRRSTRRRHSR